MQRLAKGVSQTELGDRIDVTFQQVQKYEKGTNRIGSGRLQQIATALDVPVSVFFPSLDHGATNGSAEPRNGIGVLMRDRAIVQLVRDFNLLDEATQRCIGNLVSHMANRK